MDLTPNELFEIFLASIKKMIQEFSKFFLGFMMSLGLPLIGLIILETLIVPINWVLAVVVLVLYIISWLYLCEEIVEQIRRKKREKELNQKFSR